MRQPLLLIFLIPLFSICFLQNANSLTLSDQAQISVLTCGPQEEVYALYGHSAIRVKDPTHHLDLAFNYGIFSFSAPHFIYRFAKGETDYMLYPFNFNHFLQEYKEDQRSVFEQDLNLNQQEKQQIFDFLVWNAQKENREYRYNFFFDNCASRIRDVIVKQVNEKIIFPEQSEHSMTLRQLVKKYHRRSYWLNFGVDLVVAAPADRIASSYEEMFLPDYLMNHLSLAKIQDTAGETRPLVSDTRCLYKAPSLPNPGFSITSPMVIFSLITAFIFSLSVNDYRRKKTQSMTDYLVFGINGLMGIIILWFVLFSEHPAMSPNFNLLWALPLNFLFTLTWFVKRWRPLTRWYHVFISLWLLLFIFYSQLLPQYFHPGIYLFVAMVLCRSILHTVLLFQKKTVITNNR